MVIESDERFRLHAAPVADAIDRDRAAGLTPLAIAAVAGSTNTGSVDDTVGLADVAEREGVWLHVDAAYGGAARLSTRDAHRVPGLERADSVTIDPHKWFFQAYDIGALVVRRREDLLSTFHSAPEYYASSRPEDEPLNWYQYSLEGTRRFRALKLWMSWKQVGTDGLGSSDRAERRPGGLPRGPLPRRARLRGGARGARAERRVLPAPAARTRRSGRPRCSTTTRPGCSGRSRSAGKHG